MRLAAAIAFAVVFAPVLTATLLDYFAARDRARRRRDRSRAFARSLWDPWR